MPAGLLAAISASPAAAAAAAPTRLRPILSDTVIADNVRLADDEGFDIAAGVTLTLRGDLEAAASRIFFGAGRVDLTASRIVFARPEWWGAVPGNGAIDCAPAIEAALAAHLWVQLGAGDYWLGRTLRVNAANRRLWGMGRVVDAGGTRLVLHGAGGAVVAVGAEENPGSINAFLRGVDLRAMVLGRSQAPATGATGLRARHVLHCNFETLTAPEHGTGFDIQKAVHSFFSDCTAFRSSDGQAGEVFTGFAMEGTWPGMPGANASLFLSDCSASVGGDPKLAASHGIRMTEAFADTFIIRFETTGLTDGIVIDGKGSGGHHNLRIEAPILDRCFRTGISIANLSDDAAVDIQAPYIALSERGGVCVSIRDTGGAIDIIGGQLIGSVALNAKANAAAIVAERGHGLGISRLKCLGFDQTLRASELSAFDLSLSIAAIGSGTTVLLRDCAQGRITVRGTRGIKPEQIAVRCEGRTRAVAIDTFGGAIVTDGGIARPPTVRRIEIDR